MNWKKSRIIMSLMMLLILAGIGRIVYVDATAAKDKVVLLKSCRYDKDNRICIGTGSHSGACNGCTGSHTDCHNGCTGSHTERYNDFAGYNTGSIYGYT